MNDLLDKFEIKINKDGIYIIHIIKHHTKLYLYINDKLDDESYSYESLYYYIKLYNNDIIKVKDDNNEDINLLDYEFNIYKL
jgi:hypothetical protein